MRNLAPIAAGLAVAVLLSGCGKSGFDRARPDEFAVARQPPLVIPPDYALSPPQAGAVRTPTANSQAQTLEALFGPNTARTAGEAATLDAAGARSADAGIRSQAGDPQTNVVDKGQTTQDIVAAPESDGAAARTGTPQ